MKYVVTIHVECDDDTDLRQHVEQACDRLEHAVPDLTVHDINIETYDDEEIPTS